MSKKMLVLSKWKNMSFHVMSWHASKEIKYIKTQVKSRHDTTRCDKARTHSSNDTHPRINSSKYGMFAIQKGCGF